MVAFPSTVRSYLSRRVHIEAKAGRVHWRHPLHHFLSGHHRQLLSHQLNRIAVPLVGRFLSQVQTGKGERKDSAEVRQLHQEQHLQSEVAGYARVDEGQAADRIAQILRRHRVLNAAVRPLGPLRQRWLRSCASLPTLPLDLSHQRRRPRKIKPALPRQLPVLG